MKTYRLRTWKPAIRTRGEHAVVRLGSWSLDAEGFRMRYAVYCRCGKRFTGQTMDRAERGHEKHES